VDLIAQVVAAVLSFLASIIGNIFAHDICASADLVCTKIIKAAATRLARADQAHTEQEWIAGLHEYDTVFQKYRHAVGCYLAAPAMRRCAFETPPFVEGAPGLYWKLRQNKTWKGRWGAPQKTLEKGFQVKSVKLISIAGNLLTAEDEAFLAETSIELQAELDQWLSEREEN
jgi:hypothetical protein